MIDFYEFKFFNVWTFDKFLAGPRCKQRKIQIFFCNGLSTSNVNIQKNSNNQKVAKFVI